MASLESQLLTAVQEENISEVKRLILKGVNVNNYPHGRPPLSIAAKLGNVEIVEILLNQSNPGDESDKNNGFLLAYEEEQSKCKRKKVQENRGNNGYYVVVHNDCRDAEDFNKNNLGIEELLTPEGMDNLEWDIEVENVSCESDDDDIWSNQYRWYADILEKTCHSIETPSSTDLKCDVNLRDSVGRTALHFASEHGHSNVAKLLINAGGRAEVADADGITPLHLAAARGHADLCRILIAAGAHLDSRTADAMTPLHYASSRDHGDAVIVLAEAGANLDALDSTDRTPLKLASSRNLLNIIELLISSGAKVNIEDNKGYTALCEAVWQKSVGGAEALLRAGARVKPTNYLVHYATVHRHKDMVRLLVSHGAVVNIRDSMGQTPLITAALTDQIDLIKFLIDNGAMVDYYWECTPLSAYIASKRGTRLDTVATLLSRGADAIRSQFHDAPLPLAIVVGKLEIAGLLVTTGSVPVSEVFTHPSYSGADAMKLCMQLAGEHPIFSILQLIETLILAGYNLNNLVNIPMSGDPVEKCDILMKFLKEHKSNPLSLQQLSRISVRSSHPKDEPLSSWVLSLPVPVPIREYILMSDRPAIIADPPIIEF